MRNPVRPTRNLSSGAWALFGWWLLFRSGAWLAESVATHVGKGTMAWYEVVMMLVSIAMIVGAGVGTLATLLGVYDRG